MSLLTGQETATVYAEVEGIDDDGNPLRVPGDVGVVVRCWAFPVGSTEASPTDQAVATTYRLVARSWPGGPYARLSWRGREWDVVGEPAVSAGSAAVAHSTVTVRARSV